MVDGDGAHVDEFGQVVLVRDVVSMPGDDVEGRVVLCALEELAAELIDDLPRLLLDFIESSRVEEVSSIGKTISAKGPEIRELEVGAPNL